MRVSAPAIAQNYTTNNQRQRGKFSGQNWIGTPYSQGLAEKALQSDATLNAGWLGLVSLMAQAEIDVAGRDVSPEILTFCRDMLFKKAARRFNNVFIDMLKALYFGVYPLQVILKYERGQWLLDDLWPIPPYCFNLYTVTKNAGEWWASGNLTIDNKTIAFGPPGSGKPLIFWPTFGDGLLGQSIARPIMGDHEEKQYSRELRGVGLSKSVLGTIATFERPPTDNETPMSQSQLQEYASVVAEAITAREKSSIALPYNVEKITPIYAAADSITKTIDAENHADLSILQAFGSQHIARGLLSGFGSQGAGENDSKAQQALRGFYFQWAAGAFQPLLDWIIDLNFSRVESYPEISLISPEEQTPAALVREYAQLISAGAMQPTAEDAAFFRRLLRLPQGNLKTLETLPQENFKEVKGNYDPLFDSRDPAERAEYYDGRKE